MKINVRKINKKGRIIKLIIFLIFFAFVIPSIIINMKLHIQPIKYTDKYVYDKYIDESNNMIEEKNGIYNILDLLNVYQNIKKSDNCIIDFEKNLVYNNECIVNINIKDYAENSSYYLLYKINDNTPQRKEIDASNIKLNLKLEDEGEIKVNICVYINNEKIKEFEDKIYYIKPYEKQFLDELSKNGIQVHYRDGTYEKYESSNLQLKSLGVKYVRADFLRRVIEPQDSKYDFSKYDYWIEDLDKENINIIAIANNYIDKDNEKTINTEEKINSYKNYIEAINYQYPKIKNFEIFNEPNVNSDYQKGYLNETDIQNYSKLINKLKDNNSKINIIAGATANLSEMQDPIGISSVAFYNYLYNTNGIKYVNNYSTHLYCYDKLSALNNSLKKHINLFNAYGGFNKMDITEYGDTVYILSESTQASDLVKQSITLEEYSNFKILYCLWTTRTEGNEQYGILSNDYTPRPAYYSMKNFYENTNGAEYIGHFKLADGITSHVYDKDGKIKMIIWADDNNANIDIDYNDFKAYDVFGNEIENINGKLTVTSSPIYLKDISERYYFKAINNLAVNKYNEFLEKNGTYLNDSIKNQINLNKNFLNELLNKDTITEDVAESEMKKHFEIGNELIEMYNNGELNVEYVKLSSMLDSLNDIGNSYEDLVTISAKIRMNDLSNIEEQVNKAKNLANFNEKIEIIYPNKIYKFSQDLYDKASYILGLEEENDIKTGLINSKALHAYYLSIWSQEFSKIYIKNELKNPIDKIINANESVKNSNIDIYNNKNVLNDYNNIISILKDMKNNPESITKKALVDVFEKQLNLISDIANVEEIDLSSDNYSNFIYSIINLTEEYKELYSYYVDKDDISNKNVQNKLNTLIERYNENYDLDILFIERFITAEKNVYENNLQTANISNNYLNKQRIIKVSELLTKIIDTKVQKVISKEKMKLQLYADRDITTVTNKNIVITLKHGENTTITNNNGENIYVFSENGSFKFEVSIRNETFNVPITINCIDKDAPVIEGVKQGQVYYQDVIPSSKDLDIKEVKLYCNSELVENYRLGANINVPGKYSLEVMDNASNLSIIMFEIRETVSQKDIKQYALKEYYVTGIMPGTTKDEFINNSGLAASTKIYRNNVAINKKDIINTGDIINLNGNDYILVVKGDLTGDGIANIMDVMQTKRSISSGQELEGTKKEAADINGDNKINIMDVMMLIRLTANS